MYIEFGISGKTIIENRRFRIPLKNGRLCLGCV